MNTEVAERSGTLLALGAVEWHAGTCEVAHRGKVGAGHDGRLGEHDHRLHATGAGGHGHGDRDPDGGHPKGRQVDGRGGVRAAVGVTLSSDTRPTLGPRLPRIGACPSPPTSPTWRARTTS